jgi:hypothetical protein
MTKKKELLILILISIILVTAAILIIVFNNNLTEYDRAIAYYIYPLWSFSLSYSFVVWFRLVNRLTFLQGFWLGYVIKFGIIFIPILIAPFFMLKYFIDYFKENKQ